jgi:hypothetical protein
MLFTNKKVSPVGQVNSEDLKKVLRNAVVFSAPALAVFFAQLQMGVELKEAALVAALVLYGIFADFFKKLQNV